MPEDAHRSRVVLDRIHFGWTMSDRFGPQYRGDDEFKTRARLHQSRFRVEELKVLNYNEYGNRLAPEDATAGKNFYPSSGVIEAVRDRYELADTALCRDMLRSEHIPFNLFAPLRGQAWTPKLIAKWLGHEVAEVTEIAVEWAPEPKDAYLDDHTSFDTYITYVAADGTRGALGIEVKYTEREYPWGKTERARMFDEESLYLRAHRASGLYRADVLDSLRTPRFKQLWRNQLLGEAMLQKAEAGIERFTSVLLFPSGNQHFVEVTGEYAEFIVPERRDAFLAVVFEDFVAQCRELAEGREESLRWLDYLGRRYIVRSTPPIA